MSFGTSTRLPFSDGGRASAEPDTLIASRCESFLRVLLLVVATVIRCEPRFALPLVPKLFILLVG